MKQKTAIALAILLLNLGVSLYGEIESEYPDNQPAPDHTHEEEIYDESAVFQIQSSDDSGQIALEINSLQESELRGLYFEDSRQFQYDDINFSDGSVQFAETDLMLTGINNMTLSIGRVYNSRNYNTTNLSAFSNRHSWGGFMGQGWSLQPFQRAYYVYSSEDNINKVVIENGSGATNYYLQESTNNYRDKNPQNLNRVRVNTRGDYVIITLQDTNGITYEFNSEDSELYYIKRSDDFHSSGGYLKRVSDFYGNEIVFNYKTISAGYLNSTPGEYSIFKNLSEGITENAVSEQVAKVPDTIIDTFGREIVFLTNKFQVTGIEYLNNNGTTNKINYNYSSDGQLISAGLDGLPQKTYTYQDFEPGYKLYQYTYTFCHKHLFKKHCYADFIVEAGYGKERHKSSWDDFSVKEYDDYQDILSGKLLTEINTSLGARIQYSYEEMYTRSRKVHTKISQHKNEHKNHLYASNIDPGASFPVVTRKRIYDKEWLNFDIEYPRNSWDNTIYKESFNPFWLDSDKNAYYFSHVKLIKPLELASEDYYFQDGLPTEHVTTINGVELKTETDWNYDNFQKKAVRTVKGSELQTQTVYDDYDSYYHPRTIKNYQGDRLLTTATTYYYNSIAFTGRNLLHKQMFKAITDGETEHRIVYVYTAQGKLDYEKDATLSNPNVQLSYDSKGRVIKKQVLSSKGFNQIITYTYQGGDGGQNYLVTETSNGKSTTKEYDGNTGKLLKTTGINGEVWSNVYDDYGRIIKAIDPENLSTEFTYSNDLKQTTKSMLGNEAISLVDELGRVVEETYSDESQDIKYDYYFANTPIKTYKKKNGNWQVLETYTYDSALRPETITHSDWGTTRVEYDDLNNSKSSFDYLNQETIEYKNKLGQVIKTTFVPADASIEYSYDNFGNLLQTTDPRGLKSDIEYDDKGRVFKEYNRYNTGSRTLSREYLYYDSGQRKSTHIYDDGALYKTIDFIYDSQERLAGLSENGVQRESLTYDDPGQDYGQGQLTKAETEDVVTELTYDILGRVTAEKTTLLPISFDYTIQTKYADHGGINRVIYPDNTAVSYAYDSLHRVSAVFYNDEEIVTYVYNENGSVRELQLGNGVIVNQRYEDETGTTAMREFLLTEIEVIKGENATVFNETYSLNTLGNITKVTTTHPKTDETGTKTYSYNAKSELTNIALSSQSYSQQDFKTYSYDEGGNILTFSLPDTDNTPKKVTRTISRERDQLISQDNGDGSSFQFEYDPEGNLTKKTHIKADNTEDTTIYLYNYQQQLTTINKNQKAIATYLYNYKRERVYSNTVSNAEWGGERVYYWDIQSRIIGEGDLEGPTVKYIYNGNEKIAMVRPKDIADRSQGEDIFWFINNAQGTPKKIIDNNGTAVTEFTIDEWGNLSQPFSGALNELNFTGKKYDPETGLYYFNQRYYDPSLGIFLTMDPARQYLNPYLYGSNNPLMYVDPDGEFFFALAAVMLKGALISGGINAAAQLAITGSIDLGSVGQAALGGAIGAGAFSAIGGTLTSWGVDKVLAHGVAGGVQSSISGGDFLSGFASAGFTQFASPWVDTLGSSGMRVAAASGISGISSNLVGGDFWTGATIGGFSRWFNDESHKSMYEKAPGQDQAKQAYSEATKRYGLNGVHNGEQDAWRHARWSQLMAESYGRPYSFFSGLAHELKGSMTGQPFNEFRMDMYNNWRGLNASGPIDITRLRLSPN